MAKILIACEFSGVVRDAFIAEGHNAVSCDLLPTERPGPHIQDDVFAHLAGGWDAMIFFYPCTNMASSGARWFPGKQAEQKRDINRFIRLAESKIPRTVGENPIGVLSTQYRKPDQIIQPWMFGHGEVKATCLWIKGFSLLIPTQIVSGREPRVHYEPPGPERWKNRSRFLPGIATAMAKQWGRELTI
jgi:hypothetical protein